MRIEGDIKVWIDGDKACARLSADGPEGPIVVHASAPLGPVKRQVERMFAGRGIGVSGDDTSFQAAVKRLGRKKALRRLRQLAPAAFARGGLAPYLARKKFMQQGKERLALAAAGTPAGRRMTTRLAAARRRAQAAAAKMRAGRLAAGAAIPIAMRPAFAGPSESRGLPATSESAAAALPPMDEGADRGAGRSDTKQTPPSDDGGENMAPEQDYAVEDEGNDTDQEAGEADGVEVEVDSDAEDVAGHAPREAMRRRRARAQLVAAARLLAAARRNPAARNRVRTIVSLAGEGDPKATKAAKVLAVADRIRKGLIAATSKPVVSTPVIVPPRPVLPAAPKTAPVAAAPEQPLRPKWWDVLAPWRRGIG